MAKERNYVLFLLWLVLETTTSTLAQGIAVEIGRKTEDSLKVTSVSLGLIHHTDSLKGLQLNALTNIAQSMKGVQVSGFSNISTTPFRGFQLSGISNISMGVERGMQLGAILNVSAGYMRGAQLGAYNYADSLNGSQVGLINIARSHPRGWQVGLVNITRDTIAHKLGLVNINPNTTIDYMIYGGNRTKLNAAARFRNRSTYSIVGVGTHYMGLDEKFSGALYYRLGQYFRMDNRWSLSGDLGYAHIETFEQNSDSKPERLYALQARLNLDYRINRRLGAFLSVGYEDARYYNRARHYRSGLLVEGGVTLRHLGMHQTDQIPNLWSEQSPTADGLLPAKRPRPWLSAAEVTGVNVFVHCLDRFVLDKYYAQTTMRSLRRNFEKGWVWDNDEFMTNNFGHPYHGNLYFNSARSNGLSFWQSAPYALGGSLMWEMLGETEPPAINDLMATTMGGICIGEITHRLSDVVLNDRSHGFRRFLREAAATIIDPMKGLNRILTGDAWLIRHDNHLYYDRQQFPIDFSISAGSRYLADQGALFRGEHNPYVNLYLEYGEPLNQGENNRPYDFFDAEATFGLSSNQPVINSLHLLGRIWSTPMIEGKKMKAEVGFYQHFNYYDSEPVKDGSDQVPYRISEMAAAGPGIIFRMPEVGSLRMLEQRIFVSGILFGGSKSDYYHFDMRDYNMGSGFSAKSKTHVELRNYGRFILKANYIHLFTWKGYENKNLDDIDISYLNAQGDRGNAQLLVVNPITEFDFNNRLSFVLSGSYYLRRTHYKYYDDVKASTFEVRGGLTYHF